MRDLSTIVLVLFVAAIAILVMAEHREDPAPVVHAAYGMQCKPPPLDYSRRPVRLDSRGIA